MTTGKEEANARLAAKALEAIRSGVIITDSEGRIVSVNEAFTRMSGYREEEAIGRKPNLLQSGVHDAEFYRELWRKLLRDGYWEGEIWNRKKSGETFLEWIAISAIRDEEDRPTHYAAIFSDITQRKEDERRLEWLANYDMLTRLPNRRLFQARLQAYLDRPQAEKGMAALLFVDLDGFKSVNSRYGHVAGDRLLRECANRLRTAADGYGDVYRYGGDEFMMLLADRGTEASIRGWAETALKRLKEPIPLGETEMRMSASIGIQPIDAAEADADRLLRGADRALLRAKRSGGGLHIQARGCDPEEEGQQLERELRLALARDEFVLAYQPRLTPRSKRLAGLEALIRWRHPARGLVYPGEFIPQAEETGQIVAIGDWVLEQACAQLAEWRERGIETVPVSVNLSPLQLEQSLLPGRVRGLLELYRLPSSLLELEITESSVAHQMEAAVAALRELKALGVKLSIDDFGTGYSSLAHLARFPYDTLKIDKSFIQPIASADQRAPIVTAIVKMAHSMNMTVVAEGVETSAQLRFLNKLRCEWVQGYLFCRPAWPEEIVRRYWPGCEKGKAAEDERREG